MGVVITVVAALVILGASRGGQAVEAAQSPGIQGGTAFLVLVGLLIFGLVSK